MNNVITTTEMAKLTFQWSLFSCVHRNGIGTRHPMLKQSCYSTVITDIGLVNHGLKVKTLPPLGIFVYHLFNLTMHQVTFRWSADFLCMDKVTRGHRSTGPLTLRVCIRMCHINRSKPKTSTHGDMGWWWVSKGSYPKGMVKSSQGHSKVKSAKND